MKPAVLFALAVFASCSQPHSYGQAACDWAPIEVERLPDMGTPRAGHQLFLAEDALIAVGGHTTGFISTQTAEQYRDGHWRPILPPLYPHDGALALQLRDGRFLIGGGSSEDFGIGRSLGMEVLDPARGTFTALGILDRPRAFASALELQNGDIAVSGNWYSDDAIAVLDSATLATAAAHSVSKELTPGSVRPYLFELSNGDVLALGLGLDPWHRESQCTIERLYGEPLSLPLLTKWMPLDNLNGNRRYTIGPFSYMVPMISRDSTAMGVLWVQDGIFSMLETDIPVPMNGPDGSRCKWVSLYTDKDARQAWITGRDAEGRFCLVRIDYNPVFDGGKAALSLFCTSEPVQGLPMDDWTMAVMPGGALAMAGGNVLPEGGNFSPSAAAWIFHTQAQKTHESFPGWLLILSGFVLAGGLTLWLVHNRRRRHSPEPSLRQDEAVFEDMMARLKRLMEEKELYRNPELRIEDVASQLGTNVAYVRGCIVGLTGNSFKHFVSEYRVSYVQQRLIDNPELKISAVMEDAGFTSPATFYRAFTDIVGCSPREWLEHNGYPKPS